MGKGPEQIFLQGRYMNGQYVHEKLFNVISHKGNANENHNEMLPYTNQDDYNKKDS